MYPGVHQYLVAGIKPVPWMADATCATSSQGVCCQGLKHCFLVQACLCIASLLQACFCTHAPAPPARCTTADGTAKLLDLETGLFDTLLDVNPGEAVG